MFKFLKEKLKSVVSKFSKEVEEEAPVTPAETLKEVQKKEPPTKQEKEKEKPVREQKKKVGVSKEEQKKAEKEVVVETINPNEVKLVYFVHGTTSDNEKGISTGQAQGELSALGKKQAIDLRKEIKVNEFAVIFCSDLKRAVDSARLTFKDTNVKIIQDKRLRECNYGDLNQKDEAKVVYSDHIKEHFSNGESLEDVERRIAHFLNDIFSEYKGKKIAIVAHKAPQLAIEVLLRGKSWEKAIETDWRVKKEWRPGWEYDLTKEVETKVEQSKVEIPKVEEKKGFFSRLKEKFTEEKKEEQKAEVKVEEKPAEEKRGFFQSIAEKVTTTKISKEKFDQLFNELEIAMLENNVALEVVDKIKEGLTKRVVDTPIKRGNVEDEIQKGLNESILNALSVDPIDVLARIKQKQEKPFVICFVGINGSGKTTSIAKVAHLLKKNGLSVVLAASDTFRAAAIQQLKQWGETLQTKVIAHDYGADPAAVAFDAIKYAQAHKIDVVLVDTAGRLHSNKDLIREMEKIVRVAKPDLKIFVGEAITGNDCTEQAKEFDRAIHIDGIVLAKADVDEKGGTMVSVSYVTNKPILYLGMGQGVDDLKPFDKGELVKNLGL